MRSRIKRTVGDRGEYWSRIWVFHGKKSRLSKEEALHLQSVMHHYSVICLNTVGIALLQMLLETYIRLHHDYFHHK